VENRSFKYLPLGDSYTIGEGISNDLNFPSVLVKELLNQNIHLEIPINPAVTGYTTKNLIDKELYLLNELKIDFCTLLIGVNDWVQGVSKLEYEINLKYILNQIKSSVCKKCILITIPDFSISKEGYKYARGRNISEGIYEFNQVLIGLANTYQFDLVDIFELSQKQVDDTYFAEDRLHPSAKSYKQWVAKMLPIAYKLIIS